ncbi:MAG TPA: bifunctional diguanylate cyclase/phosphodiesterase [Pyrinomonadaceae bacterium]
MALPEQTSAGLSEAVVAADASRAFRVLVIFAGACAVGAACRTLPAERLDLRFLLLALLTVAVSSRVAVRIPQTAGRITVADTFIMLALLLYGGEAAALLAVAEGFCSSLRISRKALTVLFNGAVMGCSTYATAWALRLAFARPEETLGSGGAATLVTAVCLLGLVQYVTNSGMVGFDKALKLREGFWQTWRRYYLWTSVTYFAGAAAAGLLARLVAGFGFYPVAAAAPVAAIVYLTYQTYLKSVETAAAQAAMAERHVQELNRYLAEQERISRELEESREHFRVAALHDALTGLPNRALLMNHLKLAVEHSKRRPDYRFAALFLDLDRFKVINDSLGHVAGDQLLAEVARRLESCLRQGDTVARVGGDEFTILLDDLAGDHEAVTVAERIQQEISSAIVLAGREVFTTMSIGLAIGTGAYSDPEDILRDADTAMYRAKSLGKARHVVFDHSMHASAVNLLQIETDLRKALEKEQFYLLYQPIVSLDNFKLCGFEALVRWHHPERGLVSPLDFIPIAEETGQIIQLGEWALEEACRQMHEWQEKYPQASPFFMSVNLSAKQFNHTLLMAQVDNVLRKTGLNPRQLKLEITEGAVMENIDTATEMLRHLRDLGVQLAIDDFGTGYSSLSYLHRFPIDTLKIDRSFVTRMANNLENVEIVRTIVMLAQVLGMDVVAEGVETKDQLKILRDLKCEYGQGYYFSRPSSPADAEKIIVETNEKVRKVHMPDEPPAAPVPNTSVKSIRLVAAD